MKAKDIMELVTCDYMCLMPDETIKEAVNKFRRTKLEHYHEGVKGLPVMDEAGALVGMVAVKDILRAVVPTYMTKALSDFTWEGWLDASVKKVGDTKVKEIMTTHLIFVSEDAPLMECANLFLQYNLQRLPVKNNEGGLVGVIYLRNIYYAIVRILLDEENGHDQ